MRVPFAAELLSGTPKAGTAADVEDAARVAALVQRDAQAFGATAGAAGDGLAGLESAAVTALRVRVSELVGGARAVEAAAETAKIAFGRYAQEVGRLDRAADGLLRRVAECLKGIQRSAEQLSQICAAISVTVPMVWNEPPRPGDA